MGKSSNKSKSYYNECNSEYSKSDYKRKKSRLKVHDDLEEYSEYKIRGLHKQK